MRPGSATYHEGAARLRPRQSSALRGRGGFPALCFLPSISSLFVSIPFIAGRWSLSLSMGRASPSMRAFQSPSLRGSGRFEPRPDAVRRGGVRVLIPFIAGQWSLRFLDVVLPLQDLVLIPFIAGQWSLPKGGSMKEHEARAFQSPSLRGSGRFFSPPSCGRGPRAGFNPLHCGAVVASLIRHHIRPARGKCRVSIPFIAGQWSLPYRADCWGVGWFVSIPFIAGQWSLR